MPKRQRRPRAEIDRAGLTDLPPTVDLPTAAAVLGLGRTAGYRLAQNEKFPCSVILVGASYRIPTVGLLGSDQGAAVRAAITARRVAPPQISLADLAELPAIVSLRTSAAVLGIARTVAYELARMGKFPCPLLRIGTVYEVATTDLLFLLGITPSSQPRREAIINDATIVGRPTE
ncbi:hypothetical protein [Fodinicola feengrottensis]|uniref:DNA-binding protein n=1 Tax=Fodinicola feengrottensis TaxID=435914 RepID=A0ABP4SQK7_9ACTN|nr:hypothetical protein [Fodinicola feengrottensis]